MVNRVSSTHATSVNRLLPVLLVILLIGSILPMTAPSSPSTSFDSVLEDEPSVLPAGNDCNACQSYDLYLDEMTSEAGGDGSITTEEPSGSHQEMSALGGIQFRSNEMISDLAVYGRDNTDKVTLTVFMQFKGTEGSTADVTYSLDSGGSEIDSVSETRDDPCTSNVLGTSSCPWVTTTIDFEIPSSGFMVENGEQLELNIDAQATCESSTGGVGGGSCEVNVAFGDVEDTSGTSKLELKANALADSSVRVHRPGASFLDQEVTEWSPNHRPDFRTMQFTVDVRNAFGRDDIQNVDLIMSTPNGANSEFDKTFDDDELKLDNQGLIGNYTWTYDSGISAGDYPLRLEISDVQGHTLVFEHSGITFIEHDIYLSLPSSQPDTVLIAPGQTSSIEFLIEHTGSTSSSMNIVFDLVGSPFPSSWSDPIWDQAGGYTLNGGGTFARPILSFDVVDGDLTNAPSSIEIEARAYADTENAQNDQVAIKTIVLSIEESDVLAPPRIAVFEDFEHQIQIADSTRVDAYDETLSHYVDAGDTKGEFFVDVFNAGFITDSFRLRVTDLPDAWQFKFFDNDTGMELTEEGIYSTTPDIGSNQILTLRMEIFPPNERDAQDIGLVEFSVSSTADTELSTQIAFTVHRTFGILVEVIADSDGGTLGTVGPVSPGSSMYYNMRITDSSETLGQTTWRIKNPAELDRNLETPDGNPDYGTWDYDISNGTESNIVVVYLEADEHVDIKLDLTLRSKVEAGFHTIYVRVIEEGVDSEEARYFDLPITVEVRDDVQPGQLEITDASTEIIRFESDEERNINFKIDNQNNIPLDVVITLEEPDGWDGLIRASSDQNGGSFLLLTLPAYSSKDFSVAVTPPSNLKDGDDVKFTLTVTPMDEEVPYDSEFTQIMSFSYQTECSGIACLLNEIMNPEPQTFALGIGLAFVLIFAVYRRGQNAGVGSEPHQKWVDEEFDFGLETVEPVVEPVVEEDDDLELLDELEDL
jgi:uncharacterized membrane protein|tara:strand:+ start:498 stop:3452 length:2955 start_codon:yes stop_codon:yes gene_type:complete